MSSIVSQFTLVHGNTLSYRKDYISWQILPLISLKPEQIIIDFYDREYKVEELRQIFSHGYFTSAQSSAKVFLVYGAHKLTPLVQNMLLKRLEEPTSGVWYILETHSLDALLPTVKSRASVIHLNADQAPKSDESLFISLERLAGESLKDIFLECDRIGQDRSLSVSFLDYILRHIRDMKVTPRITAYMDFVIECCHFLQDTNVSAKLVLENCVLGYRKIIDA